MRLGVFGGSFDPIHIGHLRLAEVAREAHGLDRVLFVPNQVSPFKTTRHVMDGALRAEMVRLAIEDNNAFALSTIELERPGPSYTVDTLRALQTEYPGAELVFVTGMDAVQGLPSWREPEAILEMVAFVAATRPGVTEEEARESLAHLPETWRARITFLTMPGLDISSTALRAKARVGSSIRYLTPGPVVDYIQAHRLYAES